MLLITGATGYVGSHFWRALPDYLRQESLAPTRQEMDLTNAESVKDYFKAHDIDRVLHLAAALDNTDVAAIFNSNIAGLYYLLCESKAAGVRHFVFASGNTVYDSNGLCPFSESQPRCPDVANQYAISKYYGELIAADMLESSVLATVRIGDIYGPNQRTGALLKAVVSNITHAKPQCLYGSGDRTRDYIYIDDVVNGLRFILDHTLSGTYNLGTGIGTNVKNIIRIAEEISDCNEPTALHHIEKEDHSKVILDVTKLTNAGWSAAISIAEGLRLTVEKSGR